ncbi:MAG: exonuclease, partial [Bacteroidota bacterium]
FQCSSGLADLCDLLGVESPKSHLDGGGVATALATGKIADVVRYCEADVIATMRCYLRLKDVL